MAGENSLQRFFQPRGQETADSLGIMKFLNDGNSWNTIIGGMVVQGGRASGAGPIQFSIKLEKQILYVDLAGGTCTDVTNVGFTASGAGYWIAFGV